MESGSDSSNSSFLIGGRHFGGDEDDSGDEWSESSDEDDEELLTFYDIVQRVHQNDPDATVLCGYGHDENVQNITEWQELGRAVSNNTHLEALGLYEGALNDHKMSSLFRGLTRSNTIKRMNLYENGLSFEGIRSMLPFLQNSNCLQQLILDGNNIQSEGFKLLFRALRDSPIEILSCDKCNIESFEIDRNSIPRNLKDLCFSGNSINTEGYRGLATLLQGANATLRNLWLRDNEIDDEGVAILVDALRNNTSLGRLYLRGNDGISNQGQILLLKLVNDAASIKATLQSNHTLKSIFVKDINDEIQKHTNMATRINKSYESNPELAGREKVIASHLDSQKRALICRLQEVDHSLYNEINPLHLPEVLSLIGVRYGQGELYAAVASSIMILLSTVNRKKCIQQQREYHAAKAAEHRAKVEELDAELAAIEAAEEHEGDEEIEHCSN